MKPGIRFKERPRRVVVTGLGIISPAGVGKGVFWDVLRSGRSCVDWITRFDTAQTNVKIAAEIKKAKVPRYPKPKTPLELSRVARYALIAAYLALGDSGLKLSSECLERFGTVIGTSVGGMEGAGHSYNRFILNAAEGINLDTDPTLADRLSFFPGSLARNINLAYGFKGRSDIISTGCTASADAIGNAFEYIQCNAADVVLAGGAESPINLFTIKAFDVVLALSSRSDIPAKVSRPFDRQRSGFVMGEGAAIIVLEELEHAKRRGAHIYCEVAAYQTTCDAIHPTASDPRQDQAARAIRDALAAAELSPESVGYISAHGTSTPINDRQETFLIKKVFGSHAYCLQISSIKSMVGHASGAAGAMQAVSCALVFDYNTLPPTINYEFPDPECDLDYVPRRARPWTGSVVLQNTFGFAGKNTALIYRRFEG